MLKNRMTILPLLGLMAVLSVGCRRQPTDPDIIPDVQKNHLQRNHVFGNVRDMATETYMLAADSLTAADTALALAKAGERQPEASALRHYSSDGYLLSFVRTGPGHDTLLRREYRYDAQAKPTGWTEYGPDGKPAARGISLYDRNHFISGEQVFAGDSLVMAFRHTTDGAGNIIRSVSSFGDFSTHTENKFNEQGLVTEIVEYGDDGKMFKTAKIDYDNYGDEVNRRVFKAGNVLLEYTYRVYAQDGRLTRKIYEDKIHRYRETWLYADYDRQKNWQTEIRLRDNRIISVRKRKITYY